MLKDNFETRINLIFIHFSIILIIYKKKNTEKFPQDIFDNIFQNIEYHLRELGYGDIAVNKKMKLLSKIFYNILLKIEKKNERENIINYRIIDEYFYYIKENDEILSKMNDYFNSFYNYCFDKDKDNMLQEILKFKY